MDSTSERLGSPALIELMEKAVEYAMTVHSGTTHDRSTALQFPSISNTESYRPSQSLRDSVDCANTSTEKFEGTGDIQHSDQAVQILEACLKGTAAANPDRHYLLMNLALTLRRRVEIQVSRKPCETLLDLHLALARSLLLMQKAVAVSPPAFDTKVQYLSELGHTGALWSTTLSIQWTVQDVLSLLDHLNAEQLADYSGEKLTGFVAAVINASTLSTAWGLTRDPVYRNRSRDVYRHTLGSLREILPLEIIVNRIDSMDFISKLNAFSFVTDAFIPFFVQLMALLMQRVVEIPLSAVVGRRAAALAMGKGFYEQGAEWLDQCLMLVWGQLNLRAPAPLDATRIQGIPESEAEGRMRQIVIAYLGLCIQVDLETDQSSFDHPEEIAYLLKAEWLKLRKEVHADPVYKDLFRPHPFRHILTATRTVPVVMLNLWGLQCDALIIRGEGNVVCIRLDGVTEEFATRLQSDFRDGLQSHHFRSRGDEISEAYRGLASAPRLLTIHRVLRALWLRVVKPILDKMNLQPTESTELEVSRLTWCLTGPTSFFPLHAAGLYDSHERGTKTYEYICSSYTPTLSILAGAHNTLSDHPEPFKGILAVSQPSADGQTPIPKTVDEIEALVKAVDGVVKLQWLNGDQATADAVLAGMEASTWVHLACHAHQYPLRSSESAFMLANGATLSLADISARVAADGELAFLSACQTAAGDFDLAEEGVHLAAGMLVAGYRSVIATSWSVRDEDAPVVAAAVYKTLLAGGEVKRNGTALALHHATRLLREKVGEEQVMRWAPFIHLGI